MAQDVNPDAFYVLRGHIPSAVQESVGAGGQGQIYGGTRRRTVTDEAFHFQVVRAWIPGRPDDVYDVIFHAIVDVDFVHDRTSCDDPLRIDDRHHLQVWRRSRHQ